MKTWFREPFVIVSRSVNLTILGVALAVACGDPLSPRDVAGTYVLQQVAGESLPTLLYQNVLVFADTLRFASSGRGTLVTVTEPTSGPLSAGPSRSEQPFAFRISRGRIELSFVFECGPNANCVAPPHMILSRTADGLHAESVLTRSPLTYRRVDSPP